MFTIDINTGNLLYNGNPVSAERNGTPFVPSFIFSPAGPSLSLDSDGNLVVSDAIAGQTYSVSTLQVDSGCSMDPFEIPAWQVTGPTVVNQSCDPITGISSNTTAASGEAGETLSVALALTGGSSNALSTPSFTYPAGWSVSGSYPVYTATGPAPSADSDIDFAATNDCSGDFQLSIPFTISSNCLPLTALLASETSLTALAGEQLSLTITVQGGSSNTASLPTLSAPAGWSLTGSYPTYSASGPAPSGDTTLTFGATNACSGNLSVDVDFTLCEPIVLVSVTCDTCDAPTSTSPTAADVVEGMLGNGGLNDESPHPGTTGASGWMNGSTMVMGGYLHTDSVPSWGPAAQQNHAGNNGFWDWLLMWMVMVNKTGHQAGLNAAVAFANVILETKLVSTGQWVSVPVGQLSTAGDDFYDRALINPASGFGAFEEDRGSCYLQTFDPNLDPDQNEGLLGHGFTSAVQINASDVCGVRGSVDVKRICIDPNGADDRSQLQMQVQAGYDPYPVQPGAGVVQSLGGYMVGGASSRAITVTDSWQKVAFGSIEGVNGFQGDVAEPACWALTSGEF